MYAFHHVLKIQAVHSVALGLWMLIKLVTDFDYSLEINSVNVNKLDHGKEPNLGNTLTLRKHTLNTINCHKLLKGNI